MFDRRLLTHFNWVFLISTLFLATVGLINLYSATSSFEGGGESNNFKAQLIFSIVGLVIFLLVISIHYRHYKNLGYVFYWGSIFLLCLVLVVGRKIYGHQSWISVGPFHIQPCEFAKIGLAFGLARHFSELRTPNGAGLVDLLPSFFLFLLPMGLVLAQGDLGSSLFFCLIYGSLVFIHGVQFRIVATVCLLGAAVCVLAYFFLLSPYQKDRINTFMHPELDRKGAGYHLVQAKIAIGSGGLSGKGYLKGDTHKLKFVPERHTDFIFTVLSEEWGFLGAATVVLGYLVFLLTGVMIAYRTGDQFSFYLCLGLCAIFFWHMVINLGGVLGLMPLTGVPLPFLSYGGSSLIINWMAVGLLMNVSMRRFMFS